MLGRVGYLGDDGVGLVNVAVAFEACRYDRIIVGPAAAVMIAHWVVRVALVADRAHSPAGNHIGLHQVLHHEGSLIFVRDAAPEAVSRVAADGWDLALVLVEALAEEACIGHPERLIESRFE